jgi:hypothetical protein
MKLKTIPKNFFLVVVFLLITGALDCAAMGIRQNQEIGIQYLIQRWVVIERHFMEERFLNGETWEEGGGENRLNLIEDVDIFRGMLVSFLNFETYRIFRLVPFSPETKIPFGIFTPNEIPEISAAGDLAIAFNEAVSKGDTKKAFLVSADISDGLIKALIQGRKA